MLKNENTIDQMIYTIDGCAHLYRRAIDYFKLSLVLLAVLERGRQPKLTVIDTKYSDLNTINAYVCRFSL